MKRWMTVALIVLVVLPGVALLVAPPVPAPQAQQDANAKLWANADRVNRRTCPSTQCGIVGQLFFREAAEVFEQRDGWVRVTKYYDGSCVGGRSEYVDSGNAACEPSNGFDGSLFAEWVSADLLVADRPADPDRKSVV